MISLNWVNDYVDIKDEDKKELAVKITKAGVNVEAVETKHIDNLVIGEVVECIDHPDSDHLHVCKVDVGDNITQIVCGASNVRKGIKVIVALPGCILPGDNEIKAGKIRGEESNGMICALFELGVEEKTEENYNKGIHEIESDADVKVGDDANVYLGLDDTVLELDIHKHRNNDCYYHIGFAYIVGAILNKKVKLPTSEYKEITDSINNYMSLKVETDKCTYYTCRMVRDVVIGESPEFIKKRLISAGMRPINNVVDISNYVMLEYGQPLHFFDKDKLGNTILVRNAKDDETIITLDGEERKLLTSDIVITDGDKPVCIAGVMGGESTEVDSNTKNIFIESAIFNPVSIRYTSSRLDLRSEASIRYGKGLNYEYTDLALDRACHLLEKYASAKVLTGVIKYDKVDKTESVTTFKTSQLNSILGLSMTDDDVKTELGRLDFKYQYKKGEFTVTIPKRRLDIEPQMNDIAEEIGKLYGYHNLEPTLPNVPTKRGEYIGDVKLRKDISKRLRALGLNESRTYTLVSDEMSKLFNYDNKEHIVLPSPMSIDKSVIRTSLIPSLLGVYDYNKARHVNDINIYEIAKTYSKVNDEYKEESKISILMKGNYLTNNWSNSVKVDFYLVKGIVENLLDYLGFKNRYTFEKVKVDNLHPGVCATIKLDRQLVGIIGRIHPSIRKDDIYVAEISMSALYEKTIKPLKYKGASKYPEINKDLAFIVKKEVTALELMNQIKKSGGRLLTDIDIFDVYTGENVGNDEKSIAFSLTFADQNKTLSDEEATEVFEKIINDVESKIGATLRNK